MHGFLERVPVPAAGLALGLVSLGGLLKPLSSASLPLGASLAALLIMLVLAKALLCPDTIREDFKNPVIASVSGTFFMTIMQLAAACHSAFPVATLILWSAAVVGHLTLIVWFSLRFARRHDIGDVFPTWFITYVGIIVASVTAPALGMQTAGRVLFWFGFSCYTVLLVIVTYRVAKRPLAEGTLPLLCIYAAPMSLSLTGYLSCFSAPNLAFVIALAILAQLLLIVVLTQLPRMFRVLHDRFYPSCAAMTFPFVITATGLSKTIACLSGSGIALPGAIGVLCDVEMALAAIMVSYAFVRYCGYFASAVRENVERTELAGQES